MNGDVSEVIILLAIVLFGACALAAAGAAHAAEATPTAKQLPSSPVTSTTGGAPVNGTSPPGHHGHGPVIHPGGHPDEVTTPYGLQLIGAPAIINSPSYVASGNGSSQIVYIHNPSVTFDFPVTPNTIAWWEAGYQLNYKAIGFTGTISVEACLTVNEVKNYPDATTAVGVQAANDLTTCPPEADVVNVQEIPRTWYKVASTNADQYVVQNGLFVNGNAIVATPVKVPMATQQILTPMRVHVANGIEYLYRDNHTGPNSADDACPPKWTTTCTNVVEGINFGTDSELYTSVFNVMTLPTALIQLKLIPRTILYLPRQQQYHL